MKKLPSSIDGELNAPVKQNKWDILKPIQTGFCSKKPNQIKTG